MSEPIQLGQGAFLPNNTTEFYCLASRPVPGSSLPDECFRAPGHEGRHAFISAHGIVVAVWGEDVHAKKRHAACCEHTPANHHCEGRPGCAWNTCGCGL